MSSQPPPDQVEHDYAAVPRTQKMPRGPIGPDLLCDLKQLKLFRRWHILMRYCTMGYAMANKALARGKVLEPEQE